MLASQAMTAERAYEAGVRLFAAGRYEAAERAWLRARSLGGAATLLIAIADTRERRGDESGAVAVLQQYLAERPEAPDRAAIESRIAKLLRSPAKLLVRSPEPGWAILLDRVPLERRTPAEIEVEPGSHTIAVATDGALLPEQTVQVGYGEIEELTFAPEALSPAIAEETEVARLQAQRERQREDLMIRRAVISTGSIAAAALVPGTVLAVLAAQENGDDPSLEGAQRNDRLAVFANVSFGLAALCAITSFTLFMTHKNQGDREGESARLRIDARGVGAAATLKF
jgi:hypothetical protein